MKKKLNILLSIILVLGILFSSYGTYCLVFANKGKPQTQNTTENPANSGNGEGQNEQPSLSTGGAKNEMLLSDNVKVFAGDEAATINNAITEIGTAGNQSYSEDGMLQITMQGKKEDLLGDLQSGDVFLLDGNKYTPFSEPYILKVSSISDYGDETVMYVCQPSLSEAFSMLDVGLSDAIKEENLLSSKTIPGVSAYFASSKKANGLSSINNKGYTVQPLSTASSATSTEKPEVKTLANDYSVSAGDLVIELDVDLGSGSDDDDELEFESGRMEGEISKGLSLKGQVGIRDLTAHMVVDMPSALDINELYFGLSGEVYSSVGIHGNLNGNFKPEETEIEFDGKFIDASISGLDEKAIPLGIWHFSGTTLISVTTEAHEKLRLAPSIFLILYSDIHGNIDFDFGIDFEHSYAFNSGLRVFKEGKPYMQPEVYPYQSVGNEIKEPEESIDWKVNLTLDADIDFTVLGSSASFFIAGVNIGEIAIFELGAEAACDFEVTGSKKDGITFSDDNGAYLRMYLQLLELRARLDAEIEAFKREFEFGGEFDLCLLDLTLFEIGEKPSRYKKTPVSTKTPPGEFDSIIMLVGDVSGSMDSRVDTGETKIEAAREAGLVITDMVQDWSTRYEGVFGMGVVQFSSTARVLVTPHNDYQFISASIESMGDGGGTDIESGIRTAIEQIDTKNAKDKTIILMTDGEDSNHSGIIAQANIAKEKGIKIYTIGFGNGVNTELLTEVANITGGEYRFADTSNMVGIIGGFMYAYQSSQADVLGDFEGTVSEGETVYAGSFKVPDRSGDLNTTLYWPGSFLELNLIDPNNRVVDKDYPGATIDESKIPSTITVKNPLPGEWKTKVKGVETSYEHEPYYMIASFKEIKAAKAEELLTYIVVGAYCMPLGVFMILTSIMFIVLINSKRKLKAAIEAESEVESEYEFAFETEEDQETTQV